MEQFNHVKCHLCGSAADFAFAYARFDEREVFLGLIYRGVCKDCLRSYIEGIKQNRLPRGELWLWPIPLSGEAYLSFGRTEFSEDQLTVTKSTMQTQKVSLDGVKLKVSYEYLATGVLVHLSVAEIPADWTDEMAGALLSTTGKTTANDYRSAGIANDVYIDGVLIGEASQPESWVQGEIQYILPVYPDQYANVQSVVMKLSLAYLVTYNGADLLSGEIYTIPDGVSGSDGVVELIPLTEITVPLPKD